jgi:hypothetical protein
MTRALVTSAFLLLSVLVLWGAFAAILDDGIKALARVLDQPQERHFGVGVNVPGRKPAGERTREGTPLA